MPRAQTSFSLACKSFLGHAHFLFEPPCKNTAVILLFPKDYLKNKEVIKLEAWTQFSSEEDMIN